MTATLSVEGPVERTVRESRCGTGKTSTMLIMRLPLGRAARFEPDEALRYA